MILMIGLSMLMNLAGMALQVCFWAATAYWVAKMGHKGWRAGK